MSQVIEILTSLGIDSSVYMQFGVFFVAYVAMSQIAFKPYLEKYNERLRRTVGGQEQAESLLVEADHKEKLFKEQARKLNSQISKIFNQFNTKAKQESEALIKAAQIQAERDLEQSRKELDQAVSEARTQLGSHLPTISKNIQNKFVRH
jgi:F-type H+-transporting ATPase subunit b